MSDNIKFLNFFQEKLDITTDELADFLFIDKRTLYNYKSLSIQDLPYKVREKMLIFFQGFQEYYKENMTMMDVYKALNDSEDEDLNYIKSKFLETAMIRKKNLIVTNTKELFHRTQEKRDVKYLDEFLVDLRILMQYSNLSKGYMYSLFEIIIAKLGSENDYKFLDYINKYNPGTDQ